MSFIKPQTKFTFLAAAALILGACGMNGPEASSQAASQDSDLPYIGIMQLASHPALDAITEGIIDQLAKEGYVDGETATIDLQNAQGDQSNMQ